MLANRRFFSIFASETIPNMKFLETRKYRQWAAICLLLTTVLWVAEPVFHNFHDHKTELTAKHKHNCVVCMELSMPFQPAKTVFSPVLYLVLLTTFIYTVRSFSTFERQLGYHLRGPPSMQ